LLFYVFFFNKVEEQVLPGVAGQGVGGRGEVAQIMYTHISKCKNNKIKSSRGKKKQQLPF
jgi:hypothetical protein